jgi:hypothetical protein
MPQRNHYRLKLAQLHAPCLINSSPKRHPHVQTLPIGLRPESAQDNTPVQHAIYELTYEDRLLRPQI